MSLRILWVERGIGRVVLPCVVLAYLCTTTGIAAAADAGLGPEASAAVDAARPPPPGPEAAGAPLAQPSTADAGGAVIELDSILPSTVYPGARDGHEFMLRGRNLKPQTLEALEEVGGRILPVETGDRCKLQENAGKPCIAPADSAGHVIAVSGYHPRPEARAVDLRIRAGDQVTEPRHVVFSVLSRSEVRLCAAGATLAIVGVLWLLVGAGLGIFTRQAGPASSNVISPWKSLFLEKETNSYSLSKLQLLAWTFVTVFSYIYLYTCRVFVQADYGFPPIPSGWPTLLGVSAGTLVVSAGMTSARGPKGAGPVSPSLGDFVMSGGLVAGDRLQLFVWTLVGCAGFVGLVIAPDPAALTDLPQIPEGLLYLTGISAAGYLGGKVTRLPGPVIRQVEVHPVRPPDASHPHPTMEIEVQGENLAKDALVAVDGVALAPFQYSIGVAPQDRQERAASASFYSRVTVTLKTADAYIENDHRLTLTNQDGQMAECAFPVSAMSLGKVALVDEGAAPVEVTVPGENFGMDWADGAWLDASGQTNVIPKADIKTVSEKELKVKLIPGPPGTGTLVLRSALGLGASASVTIRKPGTKSGP